MLRVLLEHVECVPVYRVCCPAASCYSNKQQRRRPMKLSRKARISNLPGVILESAAPAVRFGCISCNCALHLGKQSSGLQQSYAADTMSVGQVLPKCCSLNLQHIMATSVAAYIICNEDSLQVVYTNQSEILPGVHDAACKAHVSCQPG
jgi:hypothetical protein